MLLGKGKTYLLQKSRCRKMRTSHVGSFPLENTEANISKILNDLWQIGLDAPPYPQLRSFIDIYLEPLVREGILASKNGFYYLREPKNIENIVNLQPHIPEAEYTIKYIRENKLGFKWLRGPVTGVFTLASRIYVDTDFSKGLSATLISNHAYLDPIIKYVRKYLEYLSKQGYNILFVDEPTLGIIVGRRRILFGYSDDDIRKIYDQLFYGLGMENGIHVCGRISPRLFEILATTKRIKYLNFEFHDKPQNIESIDKSLLIEYDKYIAPGVASAKKPVVESIDEIRTNLMKLIEKTDHRIDLVSADCGFGGLVTETNDPVKSYNIGLEKLKNIIKAVKSVKEE
ncbi:MAG: methionine synthase [Staphylothermus sp.]|nr:methionine synthase [Staphylothermus sp.]